jgi:hypothetical protein
MKFVKKIWKYIVVLVLLVVVLFIGRDVANKSTTPAPPTQKQSDKANEILRTKAAQAAVPAKIEEAVVRDGIRESLKMEYGNVNRTVEMKNLPTTRWEIAGNDPNLRFPVDSSGDLILGLSATEPPAVVDPEPGYRWVKVEINAAPVKWQGAVRDTSRVFGLIPAALKAKQGK